MKLKSYINMMKENSLNIYKDQELSKEGREQEFEENNLKISDDKT